MASAQQGLITRAQLGSAGMNRWAVAHRIDAGLWTQVAPTVIATFSGRLDRDQRCWAAVLHAGPRAVLAGATALEVHGLRRWERDEIHVAVPYGAAPAAQIEGVRVVRTRRPFEAWTTTRHLIPTLRLQPAALTFASSQRSERARTGVLAAVVQQQLTTPEALNDWLPRLAPLRGSQEMTRLLADIADGAQSTAEIDVMRMCDTFSLARPVRQTRRRDSSGRTRFTDCEWRLPDGRVVILEVDGAFHMDATQWEDDIVRRRGLSDPGRIIVDCTARELRDCPDQVAADLVRLGVPRL